MVYNILYNYLYNLFLLFVSIHRGDSFHFSLLHVGELRSLLPDAVFMMGLTATATSSLRRKVSLLLGMRNPLFTHMSPCKDNIFYTLSTFTSIEDDFNPLLEMLHTKRLQTPRTIIYCRRYHKLQHDKLCLCCDIYVNENVLATVVHL